MKRTPEGLITWALAWSWLILALITIAFAWHGASLYALGSGIITVLWIVRLADLFGVTEPIHKG